MWWHIWAADKPLKGCVNTVCSVTLSSVRLAHLSTATRTNPLGSGSQPPTALGECQTPSSKSYRITECLRFRGTCGSICSNLSSSRTPTDPGLGMLSHYHTTTAFPDLLCLFVPAASFSGNTAKCPLCILPCTQWWDPPEPPLLQPEQPLLSQSLHIGEDLDSLQVLCLLCIGEPRTEPNIPGVNSAGQRREEGSPPPPTGNILLNAAQDIISLLLGKGTLLASIWCPLGPLGPFHTKLLSMCAHAFCTSICWSTWGSCQPNSPAGLWMAAWPLVHQPLLPAFL